MNRSKIRPVLSRSRFITFFQQETEPVDENGLITHYSYHRTSEGAENGVKKGTKNARLSAWGVLFFTRLAWMILRD